MTGHWDIGGTGNDVLFAGVGSAQVSAADFLFA